MKAAIVTEAIVKRATTGLLTLLLLAPFAFAEEAEQPDSTTAEASAPQEATPENQPEEAQTSAEPANNQADPVFVPTEEISEDLSVPFPVDI